jgi:hypothetical protein
MIHLAFDAVHPLDLLGMTICFIFPVLSESFWKTAAGGLLKKRPAIGLLLDSGAGDLGISIPI